MEKTTNEQQARRLSLWFVLVAAVIVAAIVACIALVPYDPGVLIGTSLSGNNQYGGTVSASKDYLFYTKDKQIMRLDYATQETKSIYTGDVSHLNPYDGWLYFVEKGQIKRIGYYGGDSVVLGEHTGVQSMSVNGLWMYYLTQDGQIHKLRTDGKKGSTITDGSIRFKGFESANRILLACDGKTIYRMKTDGTQCEVLVKGSNISRMIYTLDQLYYCDEGVIYQIPSVEAGVDDGTEYELVQANIFNFDVDEENRGVIYYVKGDQLRAKKLQSVEHAKTQDVALTTVHNPVDVYSVAGDLYYHNAKGELFRVRVNQAECTVESLG